MVQIRIREISNAEFCDYIITGCAQNRKGEAEANEGIGQERVDAAISPASNHYLPEIWMKGSSQSVGTAMNKSGEALRIK